METGYKVEVQDHGRPPPSIEIQETVTFLTRNHMQAALYAYFNDEQIAALDFTRSNADVHINMVFVKPQFRSFGIGSALVQDLARRYPAGNISCRDSSHGPFLDHALNMEEQVSCIAREE